MAEIFSILGKPQDKPTAVGESGWVLPVMPDLSGQDAVKSLIGYYRSGRFMDSKLNPHAQTEKPAPRSTNYPHTKVARIEKNATRAVKSINVTKSGLVKGFMEKCAKAQLTAVDTLLRIAQASDLHPLIATEFEKCGFEKQAIGFDYHSPAGDFSKVKSKLDVKSAPSIKPDASAGVQIPSWASETGNPAPPLKMDQPQVPRLDRIPDSVRRDPPTGAHAQKDVLGQGLTNAGNWLQGLGQTVGSSIGEVGGRVWQGGARATDAMGWTRDATEMSDAFTGEMARGRRAGANTIGAALSNQDPRQFAVNHGVEDVETMRANQQAALRNQKNTQNDWIAPSTQAGLNNYLNQTGDKALQSAMLAKVQPLKSLAYMNMAGSPLGQTALGAVGDAPDKGLNAVTNAIGNTDSFQAGKYDQRTPAIDPQGIHSSVGFDPETGEPTVRLNNGQIVPISQAKNVNPEFQAAADKYMAVQNGQQLTDGTGRVPLENPGAQLGDQTLPSSPPAGDVAPGEHVPNDLPPTPSTEEVLSDPAKAKSFVDQSSTQVKQQLDADKNLQNDVNNVVKGGDVSDETKQKAADNLMKEVQDPEQAKSIFDNMSTWEMIALAAGLTVGGIGLMNTLSGEGGIGSWLMTLLGLGTAGVTASNMGMFGEGAQGFTQGLTDKVTGGIGNMVGGFGNMLGLSGSKSTGGAVSAAKPGGFGADLEKVMKNPDVPDSAKLTAINGYLAANPDVKKIVDQYGGQMWLASDGYIEQQTGMPADLVRQAVTLYRNQ